MTAPARLVLVLDDDEQVLKSLERLLTASGFAVRSYDTPGKFFAAGLPSEPTCLLLDQHLGLVKGTEVHAEMQRRGWDLPTIFLTADWDTHTVVQAMRGGADNYLTKPFAPDELLQAINATFECVMESSLRQDEEMEMRRRAARLTPRERTIVSLVTKGLLNKQIAEHLQMAVVTVKLHRGRAMRKLGAQNAAELARIALRAGL